MIESRMSNEYDGRMRLLFAKECEVCKHTMWLPKHRIKNARTCSVDCRSGLDSKVEVECAACHQKFGRALSKATSKSGLVFCSRVCKDTAQRIGGLSQIQPTHYGSGASVYRDRALRHHGAVCRTCGYDEKRKMLDVDHIDSNRSNNDLDNLQVLCVWCHAEKTRANWPE